MLSWCMVKLYSSIFIVVCVQIRKSLKSGHAEDVTGGGNALKLYSAVCLRMNRTRLNEFQYQVPQSYVLCMST
ncbi:hypothetical protein SADUNF_Sadunf16G0051600 [Salix dunnii]|uniref:Secreted protein n=1 Tax=Salix dunnii TaxID=1413687 RepID=A0A835MKY0_9ROSI|nr:hypothetical protein SADUNF_Sadunf16G0051600 [Salix dunnii]